MRLGKKLKYQELVYLAEIIKVVIYFSVGNEWHYFWEFSGSNLKSTSEGFRLVLSIFTLLNIRGTRLKREKTWLTVYNFVSQVLFWTSTQGLASFEFKCPSKRIFINKIHLRRYSSLEFWKNRFFSIFLKNRPLRIFPPKEF